MKDMTMIKNICSSCLLMIFGVINLYSQESDGNIIQKALKDELKRNMEELLYQDNEKPFYISYTVSDINLKYANASLGAIINTGESKYKDWFLRVMMGDYNITDENYEGMENNFSFENPDIELPMYADYDGIRRTLWIATDKVYKKASELYKSKLAALKEKNLTRNDLLIDDFSEAPVVKLHIERNYEGVNISDIETIVKELSVVFKEYPDIIDSEVFLFFFRADINIVNSEGTEISAPMDIISLIMNATAMDEEGEVFNDHLLYFANDLSELPDKTEMKEEADQFARNIIEHVKAKKFENAYTGPVLILDQAVAELFAQSLFASNNSLIAFREPLYNIPQQSIYYDQKSFSIESKIGKKIISDKLSVLALPGLKNYKGVDLFGNFRFDAEGVIPGDSLILVENGILKTLLNGRTPTHGVSKSNGHNRFVLSGGGITRDISPGVIKINSTDKYSVDELKKMLLDKAKEEGFEYGIIIRPSSKSMWHRPLNVYRISIDNREEELIRSVNFKQITQGALKRIIGTSSEQIVYNTILSYTSSSFSDSFNTGSISLEGIPSSFIVPNALLLEEIEIEGQRMAIKSTLPFVENPIGK